MSIAVPRHWEWTEDPEDPCVYCVTWPAGERTVKRVYTRPHPHCSVTSTSDGPGPAP